MSVIKLITSSHNVKSVLYILLSCVLTLTWQSMMFTKHENIQTSVNISAWTFIDFHLQWLQMTVKWIKSYCRKDMLCVLNCCCVLFINMTAVGNDFIFFHMWHKCYSTKDNYPHLYIFVPCMKGSPITLQALLCIKMLTCIGSITYEENWFLMSHKWSTYKSQCRHSQTLYDWVLKLLFGISIKL